MRKETQRWKAPRKKLALWIDIRTHLRHCFCFASHHILTKATQTITLLPNSSNASSRWICSIMFSTNEKTCFTRSFLSMSHHAKCLSLAASTRILQRFKLFKRKKGSRRCYTMILCMQSAIVSLVKATKY